MAKSISKSKVPTKESIKKTRSKLRGSPFTSVSEMNEVSNQIRMVQWKKFESSRIFDELVQQERYGHVRREMAAGLSTNLGTSQGKMVRVFSPGTGVVVDVDKDIFSELETSQAEALIRALSDSFSKSYYGIKGLFQDSQLLADGATNKKDK